MLSNLQPKKKKKKRSKIKIKIQNKNMQCCVWWQTLKYLSPQKSLSLLIRWKKQHSNSASTLQFFTTLLRKTSQSACHGGFLVYRHYIQNTRAIYVELRSHFVYDAMKQKRALKGLWSLFISVKQNTRIWIKYTQVHTPGYSYLYKLRAYLCIRI